MDKIKKGLLYFIRIEGGNMLYYIDLYKGYLKIKAIHRGSVVFPFALINIGNSCKKYYRYKNLLRDYKVFHNNKLIKGIKGWAKWTNKNSYKNCLKLQKSISDKKLKIENGLGEKLW